MIAVHSRFDKPIGFRILDTDSGQVQDTTYDSMASVLESGTVTVENLKIEDGIIAGSNGSLQRYPNLIDKKLFGKSPLIILCELLNNRYRVTNYLGEIVDIGEQEAVNYAKTEGIANGKIVTDDSGVGHISSICGSYKQDKLISDMKYGHILVAKRAMLGVSDYLLTDDYLAYAGKNKDIEQLVLTKGVLGIADRGFENCSKLKKISLPNTLVTFGVAAFRGCESLETIIIPEGVIEISMRCFENCKSLKNVYFPNTLRLVDRFAFQGCNKLKVIYCGPVAFNAPYGAIPRGVRLVRNTQTIQ